VGLGAAWPPALGAYHGWALSLLQAPLALLQQPHVFSPVAPGSGVLGSGEFRAARHPTGTVGLALSLLQVPPALLQQPPFCFWCASWVDSQVGRTGTCSTAIGEHMCVCVCACVRACMHVRACVHACACASVRVRVCVSMCVCVAAPATASAVKG